MAMCSIVSCKMTQAVHTRINNPYTRLVMLRHFYLQIFWRHGKIIAFFLYIEKCMANSHITRVSGCRKSYMKGACMAHAQVLAADTIKEVSFVSVQYSQCVFVLNTRFMLLIKQEIYFDRFDYLSMRRKIAQIWMFWGGDGVRLSHLA